MASVTGFLRQREIGSQPKWLSSNVMYETIMGSEAYGVSSGGSDVDVYGFCIPPKSLTFPHLGGEIPGFGKQIQRFEQYQEHHLKVPDRKKEYDINIFSIVKYFQLCMDNNPNMIDSLWTPPDCVLFITPVGQMVKDARHLFLHKGAWNKFRGYAASQFHKIETKNPKSNPKRQADIDVHGMDLKYCYHLVRLLLECEQILVHQDIDLRRDRNLLKGIRRGEWKLEDLKNWHSEKLASLETLYANSKLPDVPDEKSLKMLLLNCLETHYGSLADAVKVDVVPSDILRDVQNVIDKYRAVV